MSFLETLFPFVAEPLTMHNVLCGTIRFSVWILDLILFVGRLLPLQMCVQLSVKKTLNLTTEPPLMYCMAVCQSQPDYDCNASADSFLNVGVCLLVSTSVELLANGGKTNCPKG